jgi:hypothetical protein
MSRKHRKRRRQRLRSFAFSQETVKLLQEAMNVFSQSFSQLEEPPEKVAFASKMIQQINGKLAAMLASVGALVVTKFDENEKTLIAAAIQLYMLEEKGATVYSQREKELERCQQIMRFALDPGREPGR